MDWSLSHFLCAAAADFLAWTPEVSANEPWRPTSVPGAVQTSSFGLPHAELLVRKNWESVTWMETRLWVYRAEFKTPLAAAGLGWLLTLKGLDYRARIFVNGRLAADHEGMFSPVEIELPPTGENHVIHIAFFPPALIGAPFSPGTEQDPTLNLKARYMKGWDFCPRLVCVGPWDDIVLEQRRSARIMDVGVETRIENTARADVVVTVHFNRPPGRGALHVRLGDVGVSVPTGQRLRYTVALQIENPALWWPHTHGAPRLHTLQVEQHADDGLRGDRVVRRIGLRTVHRRPASGQLPTATPLQWEINGVPVFLHGMNLTPFSSVPAEVGAADYARILGPLRDVGTNLFRVWGGGLREKSAFYDWCDEHGVLVLQEFPLACQKIPRDPDWLDLLEREGRAIARSLASRACVVAWTGGNEHYHFWESVDSGTPLMNGIKDDVRRMFSISAEDRLWRGGEPSDHPALRLLEGVSREENPGSLYDITSALEDQGDVHGPWNLRLPIGDHRFRDGEFFNHWRNTRAHLFSECAVATAAHPETIAQLLGLPNAAALENLPIPSRDDPLWVAHKAFKAAWDAHPDLWFDIPETERYFGSLPRLGDLLFANHYLQCEASRYLVESLRRRQGHATGFIWWGANEPFPGLAGCALVDFFGRVKPALRVLATAMAPHLLSLDYERCVARKLRGDLVFTNSLTARFEGRYEVTVGELDSDEVIDTYAGHIDAAGYSVVRLAQLIPVRLESAHPLAVRISLFANGTATPVSVKQYLFFADDSPAPLSSLLTRATRPVESFFL
ncbi:MAG: hypothetical protein ABW223_01335 [Rariglobus sp.]